MRNIVIKILSNLISFPFFLYTFEYGLFESTLYLRTYFVMFIVLLVIVFHYILFYLCILRKYKFFREIIEGKN